MREPCLPPRALVQSAAVYASYKLDFITNISLLNAPAADELRFRARMPLSIDSLHASLASLESVLCLWK